MLIKLTSDALKGRQRDNFQKQEWSSFTSFAWLQVVEVVQHLQDGMSMCAIARMYVAHAQDHGGDPRRQEDSLGELDRTVKSP